MTRHSGRVPLTVYLVDDSPLVVERLVDMLARMNGATLLGHAAGAATATAEILALAPQVVLLDLKLADGSGFDVLREAGPRLPGTEFYLLSNFATPAYRKTAAELGAAGYFDKTTEFEALIDLLAARARA